MSFVYTGIIVLLIKLTIVHSFPNFFVRNQLLPAAGILHARRPA